jgi:2-amino-4-hydroxy-6-hydroxymethyldihydropteridine diphosphokinase
LTAPLRAVVGLGANLGDRLATLRSAVHELSQVARVEKTSRVYSTMPVGPPQPDYLNAAVLIAWDASPLGLLETLLAIEQRHGRVRAERWGARTLDLDILWIDGVTVDDARLRVPHPHLTERAFAVVPLLDVVPNARDPQTGAPYVAPAGAIVETGLAL